MIISTSAPEVLSTTRHHARAPRARIPLSTQHHQFQKARHCSGLFHACPKRLDGVPQHLGEVLLVHRRAVAGAAVLEARRLRGDAVRHQLAREIRHRAQLDEALEDAPHDLCIVLDHQVLAPE